MTGLGSFLTVDLRSALGCGVCMIAYVALTTLSESQRSIGTNWAAVAMIILYEIVFAFGWLGTCWIVSLLQPRSVHHQYFETFLAYNG